MTRGNQGAVPDRTTRPLFTPKAKAELANLNASANTKFTTKNTGPRSTGKPAK